MPPFLISLIGLGKMGESILHHLMKSNIARLAVAADIDLSKAERVLQKAGAKFSIVHSIEEAERIVESGLIALTNDSGLAVELPGVQVVIDATGNVIAGAEIALRAILARKNIVMLNAEADATVGPILSKIARSIGVVYTGDIGDEPGTIMHYLYRPLTEIGLEVVVAGKGKNNPLNPRATPSDLAEEAARKKLNPRVLTSFVDGTKTMVEMTILSNATGLLPDIRGMHGPRASLSDLVKIFRLKSDGGILESFGVVDYVIGIAPGVFTIARSDDDVIIENLRYLGVGNGPTFLFYRPYHLPGSETILAAMHSIRYGEAVISPKGCFSEAVTVAKKELHPNEVLDGIGGFTVYGTIERREIAREEGLLPVGLAEGCIMRRSKRAGETITLDDVEIPSNMLYDLWNLQQKYFK